MTGEDELLRQLRPLNPHAMNNDKKTGPLPATELIKLEINKEQWRMFEKHVLTKLSLFGIIDKGDAKVKIEIEVDFVSTPGSGLFITQQIGLLEGSSKNSVSLGVLRTQYFFHNYIEKTLWVFTGHIKGKNEIPIVIMYYEILGIAIYTQKLETDDIKKFLPFDPQHN